MRDSLVWARNVILCPLLPYGSVGFILCYLSLWLVNLYPFLDRWQTKQFMTCLHSFSRALRRYTRVLTGSLRCLRALWLAKSPLDHFFHTFTFLYYHLLSAPPCLILSLVGKRIASILSRFLIRKIMTSCRSSFPSYGFLCYALFITDVLRLQISHNKSVMWTLLEPY